MSTPAGREAARIEEVDGRRGSDSQPAESPLSKRPPQSPPSQPGVGQAVADHQRGTRLLLPTTSPLWGVAEDFFWKRKSPFMSDYSLKGEEDRCEEDCQENCLPSPLWAEELEYGERRDGVIDEEVLRCGLNKDKSRVAEQAVSTDELSPTQGDEGSI